MPSPRVLSVAFPAAALSVAALGSRDARAQDAFGLEPGVASGTLADPLTGHSPWRAVGSPVHAGAFIGYATDSVYACEVSATGTCISSGEPWVRHDLMGTAQGAVHLWDGRLTVGTGVRARLRTGVGPGMPSVLENSDSIGQAQWEDLRFTGRLALSPTDRWAVAPVANLRLDRQTHIMADSLARPALSLSPLYGLGNSVSMALPVGWSAPSDRLHVTVDPEVGVNLGSTDTHADAADLGLTPMGSWARLRAGGGWSTSPQLTLLAEAEGRLRHDAVLQTNLPGMELRAGARRALLDHKLDLTVLLGTSPIASLGSPGFRGGLNLRWTGRPPPESAAAATLPPGTPLRVTVRAPDGTELPATISLDGTEVPTLVDGAGGVLVSVPEGEHTLQLRSPGHATLEQVVAPGSEPDGHLERVLPLGDGDGVLVLKLQDPRATPLSAVDVTLTPADQPPVALGEVCGDCDLRYTGLPGGPYTLGLAAPGMQASTVPVTVGSTPPAPPADILFLAPTPGQLDIVVRDPAGNPIPDATVQLIHPSGVSEVPTDFSGRALPVVTPGRWLVEVTAPGRGRQLHEVDVQPLLPVAHDLSIRLLPAEENGADLHVEVVDADGHPVEGADILAGDRYLATTGSGGRVVLEDLPSGPMQLQVEHPDFRSEPARPLELQPGKETGASIALGWKAGAVVMRVVDAEGGPVDSTVVLEGPEQTLLERTGPDGQLQQVLAPGAWSARLAEDDWLPVGVDFAVEPDRNAVLSVQLIQQPALASTPAAPRTGLSVTVVDELDAPVEGAAVHLGDLHLGTTSTSGRLTVSGIPAGEATIAVEGRYFDPWQENVAVEAHLRSEVQAHLRSRLGQVELVAVDPNDQPIEAQVRVTGAGGQSRLSRLGTDGRRTYRLAQGYWEFAFASERNGFGVEDLTIEREQADYEVLWVGSLDATPATLAPLERRPVAVQLWSRPSDAPTPGTLRMLGPEVLPPFDIGPSGTWEGELRPGEWEALATAPELGIGGGDLPLEAGHELVRLRVLLGSVEVELTADEVTIDDTLYFALGSAELEAGARNSLQAVARTLRSTPSVRRVRVEGHADRSGSAAVNQTLSEARAKAVMQALIDLGVEPHRLESKGYGESRPVSASADGAAKDRRVVFRVLEVADAVQVNDDSAP